MSVMLQCMLKVNQLSNTLSFRRICFQIQYKNKGSPCLQSRTLSKCSEKQIPTLTELQELLRNCGKNTIPYGASECSLIVDKKMICVDLFLVNLFQDLA